METKSQLERLLELDAMHDQLLSELANLDQKIVLALESYNQAKNAAVDSLKTESQDHSQDESEAELEVELKAG